jgi:hypothetical protein
MKHALLWGALCAVSLNSFSQVQLDQPLQLTSPDPADARIEGIRSVTDDYDAANKKYVDDAIGDLGGGGGLSHYVGELFGGGIIIAVWKEAGEETGLIASLSDNSTGAIWSNVSNTAIGWEAQSSWDGLANSLAIAAQPGHTESAAQTCLDYTNADTGTGVYSDWYLPAIQELYAGFKNQLIINKMLGWDGFNGSDYWSSTEDFWNNAAQKAWQQNFTDGNTHNYGDKSSGTRIRCIRAF